MTAIIDMQNIVSEKRPIDEKKYKMIAENVSVYYGGVQAAC